MLRKLEPHLPAALLLLSAGWTGNLFGATEGTAAALGYAAILAMAAWGGGWRDPLRLGRGGGWLLAALLAVAVASLATSPAHRAGWVGLALLPAFLLLPSAVERAWPTAIERRAGLLSSSFALGAVAFGALAVWQLDATPGTSWPLGHHNLLAAWLVALLPLAALPWRDGGGGRILAATSVTLGLGALFATFSFAGAVGLAAIALAAALRHRRARALFAAVALLALVLRWPRWIEILSGDDPSLSARRAYLAAAFRGLAERSALGWGPGSSAWTLQSFLPPLPGILPPGQVVADPHSLPAEWAYELGLAGLVLVAGLILAFTLARRSAPARDPLLHRAALLALLGLGVVSLGGLEVSATALPIAAAIVAGAALAAEEPRTAERPRRWPALAYALVAALFLLPLAGAHRIYDRARGLDSPESQLEAISAAAELDPAFALYRTREAWLRAELGETGTQTARAARDAARDAPGIAVLWLEAGLLGLGAGESWGREALLEACRLDPLGAFAPYYLSTSHPGDPDAPRWAARALLAEPRLLAARRWLDAGDLRRRAVSEVAALESLDLGWRLAFQTAAELPLEPGGRGQKLALSMDRRAATAPSLHAFRRRAWPVYLAEIRLDADVLEHVDVVSAAVLPTTPPELFEGPRCTPGEVP